MGPTRDKAGHEATILIVDDEVLGRETLEGVLFGQGYELAFASDGPETLAKASELIPDLILLDVMMPGMDGFEVCRRLRADRVLADVPIIMVTALDDRDSCLKGIEAGADDFVTKPFDRLKLRARVGTITRLNRYRRLLAERIRFEWVVEHAGDGYLALDADDGIQYANPQARLYLGLPALDPGHPSSVENAHSFRTTAEREPPGETFLTLVDRQYNREPRESWVDWGEHAADIPPSPRYLVRPESSTAEAFWLQVDVLDLPSSAHACRMIRLRDVTSEVSMQRDMRGFHEAVTHKMRTPLTTMLGSLSLLAKHGDKLPAEDILELSTTALRGTERLRDTVNDILKYLHATGLAQSHDRFGLDQLGPTVDEICAHLEVEEVTVSCPQELESCRLLLSQRAVELALWEILENAKKFHPEQAPSVKVTVSRATMSTGICVQIQDDGIAISPEHLSHVWAPYYQGEKYFTGEAKGVGLGLATVAALTWGVGGSCRAYNRRDGPGVIVELVLPLEARDDEV